MITKAIYLPDMISLMNVPVFKKEGDKFVNRYAIYDMEDVLSDSDWLILSIDEDAIVNRR